MRLQTTATPSNTPSNSPTQTPSGSNCVSPTPSTTQIFTSTPTNTPTITPTETPTNTPTQTITPTNTETPTNTATPTVTPSETQNAICPEQVSIISSSSGLTTYNGTYDRLYAYSGGTFQSAWYDAPIETWKFDTPDSQGNYAAVFGRLSGGIYYTLSPVNQLGVFPVINVYSVASATTGYLVGIALSGFTSPIVDIGLEVISSYKYPSRGLQNNNFYISYPDVCPTTTPTPTNTATPTLTPTQTTTTTPTQTPTNTITPTTTITPSPSVTATLTPTNTNTPTSTTSPTPTCSVTTQYLNSFVTNQGDKIRLNLWNDAGYTVPVEALCDYVVSGTMLGSSGTTYSDIRTFPTGDHQIELNFTPILQPGEVIIYHTVNSVNTSACTCPVIVEFVFVPPTPTPTPTSTVTPTNTTTPTNTNTPTVTPTNTLTSTPTITPTNTVTSTPTNTLTPTNTSTPTPSPTPTCFESGSGFTRTPGEAQVQNVKIYPEGFMFVGEFNNYSGVSANRIVRTTDTGSIDTSFVYGTGFNQIISDVQKQGGKYIVAGNPTTYSGQSIPNVVRLNSNGTLDTTFSTTSGANSIISNVNLFSNNDILLTGLFTTFSGQTWRRMVKLKSGGTIDTQFSIGTGFSSNINTAVIQSDDKIIAGGFFTNYSGVSYNRIIRLNSNGSIDNTFNIGTGFNQPVYSLEIQNDGKILVGGNFTSYSGLSITGLTRLNTDGTVDNTFSAYTGATTFRNKLLSDGKILSVSSFNNPIRLNSDGSLDTTFNTGTGFYNSGSNFAINAINEISPNRYIFVGQFSGYRGILANGVVVTNADGSIIDCNSQPAVSSTPTATPTRTPTPTNTPTNTNTPSETPTNTPTETFTPTPTETSTPTPTETPTPTPTPSPAVLTSLLLQEDGGELLQEDGGQILLEQVVLSNVLLQEDGGELLQEDGGQILLEQ